MLTVTDKAATMMSEALRLEQKEEYGLRLVAQLGGCSCSGPSYGLFPEKESQADDTVLTQGALRIFIDPSSLSLLDGSTIDFVDDPQMGQGFAIQNPNLETLGHEGGSCGCGSGAEGSGGECGCGGNCGCQH
ncbi:iron-sulfur cluster assembly accessory protein [Candidatus Acetothermia bacterium]|nr:iron-sulfur cluster assembly accessory protein [Candidatus Acetothermia bacterium]MBI3643744.1 iron-sulfur cluster assembly accessory protein [Candidatus Acetothermia bacterium]